MQNSVNTGKSLLKYKIGLAVLLVFAVGITVLVLIQASATKQDTKTYNSANTIANELNNYIDTNNTIPSSLGQAGIKNVPSTISYVVLSSTSYKFCATYKGSSSGFDAAGTVTDLMTGSLSSDSSSSDTYGGNTDLYINPTYHKGANCQTIVPQIIVSTPAVIYNSNSSTSSSSNTSSSSSSITNTYSTKPLCGYAYSTGNSSCSIRCQSPATTTASLIINGTVVSYSNYGKSNVTYVVKDSKNQLHTVSVTNDTDYFYSSCKPATNGDIAAGDNVRIIVDSKTVNPSAANPNVTAIEIDDFSI